MMRFLKIFIALIALVVTSLLVAPFVIDVNNYRDEISKQVEHATGRSFTIGEIHASLFPWIGVELKDVRMANASGFSRPDFFRTKRLQIQVEVMPLLSREVVIHSFKLIEPQLFLEKNSRGESNWQDLIGSSQPLDGSSSSPSAAMNAKQGVATTPSSAPFPALIAKLIVLEGGHVGWRVPNNQAIDIDDINLTITDLQQLRPVALALDGRIGKDRFQLDANIGPLGDLSKLDVSRLPIQLHLVCKHAPLLLLKPLTGQFPQALGSNPALAIDLRLEQRPDGTRITVGDVALTTDAPALFRQFAVTWKGELNRNNDMQLSAVELVIDHQKLMTLNGTITKLVSHPQFNLRVQSDPISRQWLSHYAPALDTLYAGHSAAWQNIQVGMLLRGNSKKVVFDDLQLVLNGELLQGEGDFRAGKKPSVRLTLSGHALHLDPWLPKPKTGAAAEAPSSTPVATPEGAMIGDPAAVPLATGSAEPDLRLFSSWKSDIRLTIDTLTVHNLDLTHFQVAINGKQGRYRLDPLRFGLSGGQVREVATFNINRYPLTWTESLQLKGVEVGPVLQQLADTDLLKGTLTMKTSLHGKGVVSDHASQALGGRGNIALSNGSVKGFDIAGTLRNLTSFQHMSGPKKTDFSTLSGSFTITNGVVDNRDLFMASPLFRLTGHGKIDLVAKQLDYHAKPKLVGTLTGQGDTLPVRKGLAVPISITGSFNDPKIRPEIDPMTLINTVGSLFKGGANGVGSLIKGAGSGARKLIEGVTGGVGAGLGGAIGALLGGSRTPPRGATIPSSQNKPAMIAPAPHPNNGGNRGALIAPQAQPSRPAVPPPTRQQQLQGVLGGVLNGL